MSIILYIKIYFVQGPPQDYRGSGAQSQGRAVCARAKKISGLNNTICKLINVKLIVCMKANYLAV